MIDQVIHFSVRNKFLVFLFSVFWVIAGLYSFYQLPVDAVPDITNNQVQIVTISPSLGPQEIEKFITYPVEIAVSNIPGAIENRSISRYGLSVVTIVFDEGVPILTARQLVSEKLQSISKEIPPQFGVPSLMPITTGLGEIFQYVLKVKKGFEKRYSATDLRTIQDWIIKRQLAGTKGLVEVSSFGGYVKQFEVSIDPQRLASAGITIEEVHAALAKSNENTGGSYVQKDPLAYYIRTEGLLETEEDIRQVVVTIREQIPVVVADIAEVKEGFLPRFGAMTQDGKGEVVGGITLMYKGENASKTIAAVKQRMALIQKSLPEGITIEPFLDRGALVSRIMQTVSRNLIEGGLIVIFILVLLLGNWRAGLVVASVIPMAMLFAITMMYIFGVSANLMSLGAIDFGLIVDGAVIIVESIVHRLHQRLGGRQLTQQVLDEEVVAAAVKIRQSAAFGEIIILIVYLPILALVGIEGKMFKPMALTVSFAILGALVLSLTYVPMMSALLLSRKVSDKATWADKLMGWAERLYMPLVTVALRYPARVIGSSILLLAGSLVLFSQLGAVFIPTLEEGDLAMQITMPPGSSINHSIATTTQAEKILLKNFPEVKHVISKIGTAEIPTDPMGIEDCDIMVILKPKAEWTSAHDRETLVRLMKEKLAVLKETNIEFSQPIQLRFNELLTGVKSDIAIKLYGENLELLFAKAQEIKKAVEHIEGVADIRVAQLEGLPQISIRYDRGKIAQYGLDISQINTVIRSAMAGEAAGLVFEGSKKFELVVRLQEAYRQQDFVYGLLFVRNAQNQLVPLSEIAQITQEEGPMNILRHNTQRLVTIGINVRDRDIQGLVTAIQQKIEAQIKLPSGYFVRYGGQFENLQEAIQRLSIAVPVALLLIFVLLYFTFHSLQQAFLIFTAIPFAAIGGILALSLRGMPFSISAGVGFIALFGVAVLNGIVLIGYFNQLAQEHDYSLRERILEGVRTRLRPVMMTALVASLGFLPMAIATEAGGEVQRPLATVVIGGLVSSTLLTLFVLPVLYEWAALGFPLRRKNNQPVEQVTKNS